MATTSIWCFGGYWRRGMVVEWKQEGLQSRNSACRLAAKARSPQMGSSAFDIMHVRVLYILADKPAQSVVTQTGFFRQNLASLKELKPVVRCDECAEDPTCSIKDVQRDHEFQSRLEHHQKKYHKPTNRCTRFLISCGAHHTNENGRVFWTCPWCGKDDPEEFSETFGETAYYARVNLLRHIAAEHSSADMDSEEFAVIAGLVEIDGGRKFTPQNATKISSLDDLICIECHDDPSLPKDSRYRLRFRDLRSKAAHMKAKLHQPEARAIRMLTHDGGATSTKTSWKCPYCIELSGASLLEVCEHIVVSDNVLAIYKAALESAWSGAGPSLSPKERDQIVEDAFANALAIPFDVDELDATDWAGGDSTDPVPDWADLEAKNWAAVGGSQAGPDAWGRLDMQAESSHWGAMDVD
ncbi:hypothetical protein B0H10DRAFT_2202304 [Mycena sp. CBHHK59/15]|nr:hypothetical protein B0H10DRAFT_2202304 [Mycena sp. CBHHK59/15]